MRFRSRLNADHQITRISRSESSSIVAFVAWSGAPSCIKDSSRWSRIQSCIRGTIRSQYVCWLIVPQIFSQNIARLLVVSLKQSQNIHFSLRDLLSTIQIESYFSLEALVIQVHVCLPAVTQVSSIHNIEHHCSRVQSTCSWAQRSRANLLTSELSGFLRASLSNMPSFWKALRIVDSIYENSIETPPQYKVRHTSSLLRSSYITHKFFAFECIELRFGVASLFLRSKTMWTSV